MHGYNFGIVIATMLIPKFIRKSYPALSCAFVVILISALTLTGTLKLELAFVLMTVTTVVLLISVMSGTSADIALRKMLEEDRAAFTSTVSHELLTPVTALKGAIELMQDKVLGPVTAEQEKYLNMASRSVSRLNHMISDVLDYQHLESGTMVLHLKPQDLQSVVLNVVKDFRVVATDKSLELRCDVPDSLPDVTCDLEAITQVVTRLVDNAIKFTDSGHISFSAIVKKNGFVEVDVKDSGIGIPIAEQGKLFQAFKRVSTPDRKKVGSGLGLAISRKIIERHGGVIGVRSQAGEGSTFFFTLPVAKELSA